MNKQAIAEILASRHAGASYTVSVVRPAKLRKEHRGVDLVKASMFHSQLVAYAKRGPVAQAVAAGDRDAPTTPDWVASVERMPNGLTFWKHADGTEYLAMPRFGAAAKAQWMLNGEVVELDAVRDMLLASEYVERPSKQETEDKGQVMFNAIKVENVTQIA